MNKASHNKSPRGFEILNDIKNSLNSSNSDSNTFYCLVPAEQVLFDLFLPVAKSMAKAGDTSSILSGKQQISMFTDFIFLPVKLMKFEFDKTTLELRYVDITEVGTP